MIEKMKTVTILFADSDSKYMFEPSFGGFSAFEKSLQWAGENESEKTVLFVSEGNKGLLAEKLAESGKKTEISALPSWNTAALFAEMEKVVSENQAGAVIFAFGDCPFLNRALTKEIFQTHTEFLAEYTFAEGYSFGFAPEMIDAGTLKILKQLSESTQKAAGDAPVTRTAIYDFLKTDINAFEIETVLADDDYRLFRYSFDCARKEHFLQCQALFESLSEEEKKDLSVLDVENLSSRSCQNTGILKTVPGFYNIQLSPVTASKPVSVPEGSPCNKGENMPKEKVFKLIDDIAAFSETAVIDLSLFGDPVNHPDLVPVVEKILSYEGLSVFIETDMISSETAEALKKVSDAAPARTNGNDKIMISVNLDGASAGTYAKLRCRSEGDFTKALKSVSLCANLFPDSTYPQFTRMNENESELESFYRYWNEKTNPSKGNLIIQKYNSYCKTLPERKPADLSPVERNVCWHLRRDMNILSNGDVLFCHCVYGKVVGNVFEKPLSEIWKANDDEVKNQSENQYCSKCGDCDEYYTFNF